MAKLTHSDLITLLLAISTMLILSRILAEFGKRWKLPVVMGELLVGILLGPTILGTFAPEISTLLFPLKTNANVSIALDGIFSLSVIMLLFVAGMEVQLTTVLRQGRAAISTGLGSMILPFATGFGLAWYFPQWFDCEPGSQNHFLFALFMGTAMSISALPVIARILMDMNLFRTSIGMIIIASAMFNDLVGWLIFSFILSVGGMGGDKGDVGYTILYILAFGAFMLFIGRRIIDRVLPWIQTRLSWPGGVLSMCLGLCLLCAAFTESIHIHAILGSFIAGIAIGDSVHLREQAREIIHQFVTNFFAPLFFVSIGLKVNFIEHFDLFIVSVVLIVAFVGKVLGAGIGARLGGLSRRNAIAVGFGLNARGAMEIILGTLAFEAGLITQPVFVALVVMALITSIASGPLMRRFVDEVAVPNARA
ncbi:MAG: cation:proton antiporter [Bacteroidia bacterium]|jgi:Kef-type K+ transport system membrane component KefB|nr:cation:proton antiporter [Bacteroidia bacterium]